ncbi:branched-chain amino acid ABC transporter permease [Pseudomonas avellanae BPIC 631]|nr:branched-chain amino acid ABC transporter permease [Pseudomonas avellanae BPIC 631]
MFALQVGFMSPSFVGIVPSIEMVIFAAVGGRMSLLGAVYGSLLVNYGKTYFSESFPELWLYLMGGLFIAVVMYFPDGLAGLWESHGRKWLGRFKRSDKPVAPAIPGAGHAPVKSAPVKSSVETQS